MPVGDAMRQSHRDYPTTKLPAPPARRKPPAACNAGNPAGPHRQTSRWLADCGWPSTTWNQPRYHIDNHHRGQFSTAQNEVAYRNFFFDVALHHAFIDTPRTDLTPVSMNRVVANDEPSADQTPCLVATGISPLHPVLLPAPPRWQQSVVPAS